jgi:uncharacterized DUF497 family protein
LKWYENYTIMELEFDPDKSAANRDKHGIDFVEAQMLWADHAGLEIGPYLRGEVRLGRVAKMDGKHWTAIFTRRGQRVRLISVRRARKDEVARYEQAIP